MRFLKLALLFVCSSSYVNADDIMDYVRNIINFNREYPQEKVYLHMDNRSYYIGDTIWFKAYVMNATTLHPTQLSGVLYVELLNEKGVEIEHKKLRMENGMCHGEFVLKENYRTGYYEIRAYTRYMLNWGNEPRTWTIIKESFTGRSARYYSEGITRQDVVEDANHCIFSRVFPVYMHPERPGIYKNEMKWYPMHTLLAFPEETNPELADDSLRISFFPEGGHLVAGLSSAIAFEVTDEMGSKREICGWITEGKDKEIARFSTTGRGRGVFTLCPQRRKNYTAHVEYKGKHYRYSLPTTIKEGATLHMQPPIGDGDASFYVTVSDKYEKELLGWTLQCRGVLMAFDTITLNNNVTCRIDIARKELRSGVNQLTLFTAYGEILADRLFFVSPPQQSPILHVNNLPDSVAPYEEIELNLHLNNPNGWFTQGHFSLAITDSDERGENTHDTRDIRSELLLASDLKGFVENVDSYFRHTNDTAMASDIDLLMMVQGWRRYEWVNMSGCKEFVCQYPPEKGLEIDGYVISDIVTQEYFVRADKYKRIPNVKVRIDMRSNMVRHKDLCIADSLGRFHFDIDKHFYDKAFLTIRLSKNDSTSRAMNLLTRMFASPLKYSVPVLQRAFSPAPTIYSYYQLHSPEHHAQLHLEDWSMDEIIDEVEIKRKHKQKGEINYENPDMVVSYFEEWNKLIDRGIPLANFYPEEALWDFAIQINPENPSNEMTLHYSLGRANVWGRTIQKDSLSGKGRGFAMHYYMPKYIRVYSNLLTRGNSPLAIDRQTAHRIHAHLEVESYSPKESPYRAPYMLRNGTRQTYFEGYSRVASFYSPDYSGCALPDTADYRRTLYWNPDVWTDHQGRASVTFYNNKNTKHLHVRAEGFTRYGEFIVYDSEEEL